MVFGRVIRGYDDVIPKIVDIPTDEKDRPKVPIVVSNCGELELRKKPVAPQPQQRKDHFFLLFFTFPPVRLCDAACRSSHSRVSPELATCKYETRLRRGLTTIPFTFHAPFYPFLNMSMAKEAVASRDVTGEEEDLSKRSRSKHKHKKRGRHRQDDDSDGDSRSRSRSLSSARSLSRPRVRSGSPSRRDDLATDSESGGHHRDGSSRKRHRTHRESSTRKHKRRHANHSRPRSRSPTELVDDEKSRNPDPDQRKETEEEYDARLEKEENERIAAEKQRRLEILQSRHQRDLEKPPQGGIRFKGV